MTEVILRVAELGPKVSTLCLTRKLSGTANSLLGFAPLHILANY